MIELDISNAVALYLFLTVVSLLLLWLLFDRETKPKHYTSEKKSIWQCKICTFTYVDSEHDIISKCPRCGSYNKRESNEVQTYGTNRVSVHKSVG